MIDKTYHVYNKSGEIIGKVFNDSKVAIINGLCYQIQDECRNESDSQTLFKCSRCGCNILTEVEYTDNVDEENETWYEPTIWIGNRPISPRYCVNCGAEVREDVEPMNN